MVGIFIREKQGEQISEEVIAEIEDLATSFDKLNDLIELFMFNRLTDNTIQSGKLEKVASML